jgi:von Willebrand factor A domain-containing protein 8
VGKNKVVDRLLHLLGAEREYIQLHRDTTLSSLTVLPSIEDGVLSWQV